MTNPSTHTF